MHQSCAAVPSAYLAVVRRWLCSFLPGRWWCSAWAFSLFSVFYSSACGWLSPLGALVFVGLFVAGLLRRTRLVAPRESTELVLVVFLFFVLLLVLAAEERFLLPC